MRIGNIEITFLFAWYDLWVGFYWDRDCKKLYILPVPMLGVVIDFDPDRHNNILKGPIPLKVTSWHLANKWVKELDWYMEKAWICEQPNPAHLIMAVLTVGMEDYYTREKLDIYSFTYAADRFYEKQMLPAGGVVNPTAEQIIEWVCNEVKCFVFAQPGSGKIALKLDSNVWGSYE